MSESFVSRKGRPATSPRLIVRLLYSQHAFDLSDEESGIRSFFKAACRCSILVAPVGRLSFTTGAKETSSWRQNMHGSVVLSVRHTAAPIWRAKRTPNM